MRASVVMVDMNGQVSAERQFADEVEIPAAYPRLIAQTIHERAQRDGLSVNEFLVGVAAGQIEPCKRESGRPPTRFPVPLTVQYPRLIAEQIHSAAQREGMRVDEFLARLVLGLVTLVEEDPVARAQQRSTYLKTEGRERLRVESEKMARVVGEAEAAAIVALGNLDDYGLPSAQRRVVDARLANPGLSYRQLGVSLGMTKHAVSGLMRRFWNRVDKGGMPNADGKHQGGQRRPAVGPRQGPRPRKTGPRVRLVSGKGTVSYSGRTIRIGQGWKGRRVIVTEPTTDHVVIRDHTTGAVLRELDLGPVGSHHGNGRKAPGAPCKTGPRVLLVKASGSVSYCGREICIGRKWQGQHVVLTETTPGRVVVRGHTTNVVLCEVDLGAVGTYHGTGRQRQRARRKAGPRALVVSLNGCVSYCGRTIGIGQDWAGQRVIVMEPTPERVVIREQATGAVLRELDLGPVGTYHGTGRKPGRRPGTVVNAHPLSPSSEVA